MVNNCSLLQCLVLAAVGSRHSVYSVIGRLLVDLTTSASSSSTFPSLSSSAPYSLHNGSLDAEEQCGCPADFVLQHPLLSIFLAPALLVFALHIGYQRYSSDGKPQQLKCAPFDPALHRRSDCVICLSDLQPTDPVPVIPCRCAFCPPCLWQWLQHHARCPVCSQPLALSGLIEEGQLPGGWVGKVVRRVGDVVFSSRMSRWVNLSLAAGNGLQGVWSLLGFQLPECYRTVVMWVASLAFSLNLRYLISRPHCVD